MAIISTASLFFFRVRAVFDGNRWVVGFFVFMWLAVVAGMLTVTAGVTGAAIGDTKYCLNSKVESYVGAASIIPLVNDTLVFLTITYRLVTNSHMEYTLKDGFRTLVFGDYLPAFSRALLQDGQRYYLSVSPDYTFWFTYWMFPQYHRRVQSSNSNHALRSWLTRSISNNVYSA